MNKTELTLASIYLTFFIDNLSWSIVFPIFAPYFLDPHNSILPADFSVGARTTVLGFFLMAFSFGQFFGAPLLGEYADKHGRKKALAVSVFFACLGMALSAWSMGAGSLFFLFTGRLITGLFAGNTSVCLACVSDLSEVSTKARNFGLLSACGGISFVLGAFFGGKLSDPSVNVHFSPQFPLWIATALTMVNFFVILFAFKETFTIDRTVKYCFFESFKNIKRALKTEKIKQVYLIYFLFFFTWTILFQFIPVLVVDKFYYTSSNIGDLALYMGVCWVIGSGYLSKLLLRFFTSTQVLELCLIGFAIFCGFVVFPTEMYGVLLVLGICVILGSLAWPLWNELISNMAPPEISGKVLGMSQSVQSFAMAIAPLIGGLAIQGGIALPFILGSAASLTALILYFSLKEA